MSDHWDVRGQAHGWEEQLYPDVAEDDDSAAEDRTTE